MRIGDVNIPSPVVLAPMAGVTDISFRTICRRVWPGLLSTEMINARALIEKSARSFSHAFMGRDESPIAAQIVGSDPGLIREAANIIVTMGADIIDINMGCPVPKVVKKGEGAALMKDPSKAQQIVEAVAGAVAIPVTVKLRKGWSEGECTVEDLAPRLEGAGAAGLTIHARTRDAMYSGAADWVVIERVKARVSVPVIGNGDLREVHDGLRMMKTTGCDGIMVGRAALGNPWILREMQRVIEGHEPVSPTKNQRLAVVLEHMRLLREFKGERVACLEMRKHAAWYVRGLPGASKLRGKINEVRTIEAMRDLVTEFLEGE